MSRRLHRILIFGVLIPILAAALILGLEETYSVYVENLTSTDDILTVTSLSDDEVQKLYQVLKDVTELLDKAGIGYAADGGTLLGAVRNGGLIPWDDDADLIVFDHDEERLQTIRPYLEKLGYRMSFDAIYRVSEVDIFGSLKFPVIDIFIVKKNPETNKIDLVSTEMQKRYPQEWYFSDKFFPLKLYQFGPIQIYGSSNPESYLSQYYGANFKEEIHICPKHWYARHQKHFILQANEKLLRPALPKSPLADRVKSLNIKEFGV